MRQILKNEFERTVYIPHQLRHEFATKLTEMGVDLLTLKTLLGHSQIQTIFAYVSLGDDFLEKRIRMAQNKWKKLLEAYEALLTSLSFLHAVQPMRMAEIKLSSINVERNIIHMKAIPYIYLKPIEVVLIKEYLLQRVDFPNQETNSHLFIRRNRGDYIPDKPVTKTFITKFVQLFSEFGPQTLRITCLQEMAAMNGPNFLREAYGVSETHAGRYGSYEEYLVEESLNDIGLK